MKPVFRWTVYAAIIAALLFAMVELALRALVVAHPQTGVQIFGRAALLPYRPSEASAREVVRDASAAAYVIRDADLGWTLKPNGRGGLYEANDAGLRGRNGEHVDLHAPTGKVRIAVYGDSFTHGDEVSLEDTWPFRLGKRASGLDVLNFGVPGYGMDQAYLRYERDGARFDAHIHMLCIWPEDIVRNLNVIRFYLIPHSNLSTSKPRLVLGADGRSLTRVNVPTMGDAEFLDTVLGRLVHPSMTHDAWYDADDVAAHWLQRPFTWRVAAGMQRAYQRKRDREAEYFQPGSEANRLAVAIAQEFAMRVTAAGGVPIITVIPAREYLDRHAAEGGWPLVRLLRDAGIEVIDLGPPIAQAVRVDGVQALFLPSGHMTALGNDRIAAALATRLSAVTPSAGR